MVKDMYSVQSKSKRLFCFILSMMSILNGYSLFFLKGFSLAMIISSFYAVYSFILYLLYSSRPKGHRIKETNMTFICVVLVLVAISLIALLSYPNTISIQPVLYDVSKLTIWVCFVTFACRLFFDYDLFVKYMIRVAIIATLYIVLQYLLYYILHKNVPNAFNFGIILPYSDKYLFSFSTSGSYFRPGSFWLEPAFLGYYMNCLLAICFFDPDCINRNTGFKVSTVTFTACLSVILSLSTGAIGIMFVLIAIYIYRRMQKVAIIGFATIILLALFGYYIISSGIYLKWGNIGNNIGSSIYKIQHLNTNGRTGDSFGVLSNLEGIQKVFGIGIGNDTEMFSLSLGKYMNSITTIIVWTGYLGIIIFFIGWNSIFRKVRGSIVCRILLIIFALDGVFSAIYFSAHSFAYLSIILYSNITIKSAEKNHNIKANSGRLKTILENIDKG